MTKCIAFHSYKGGTGKTTLACNSAVLLARKGYCVCLLDLDIYAPSFQLYFAKEPRKWINDFLTSNVEIQDVMIDATDSFHHKEIDNGINIASDYVQNDKGEKRGKLLVGFSNPQKKEIFKLETADTDTKRNAIRRFIHLREKLISEFNADYIIVDTSPGIRFWSINSLAIADILLLTLKMSDLDIDGTKTVAAEIYRCFTKLGSKAFLVCNMVAGYCVPQATTYGNRGSSSYFPNTSVSTLSNNNHAIIQIEEGEREENKIDMPDRLSTELGIDIISCIPCYCDIQFLRKEFLTALKYKQHPFAAQIDKLIRAL
jgi:chromosome partitioning protein